MTKDNTHSITIHVDGRSVQADPQHNLLESCLSLGFDLPYFCWHPAMGSVGACRQCAVKQFKDESDEAGRIVMACMTPSTEGAHISIEDPEAQAFRASVVEWLMLNHPHDCPVCDEGGECHLQDMTVMTGHVTRRYRESKRTYRNQYLGPFVTHEMNRCIQCYRCVRFYRDIAGGEDLNAFGSRDRLYFGRMEDGTLESAFSGNLVEVCPTGVFTDKTLSRHYSRKWDMQSTPSICSHCSLGCNVHLSERAGIMRRVSNRYHSRINGYFLCDRGRFGYEYVNHPRRLRRPAVRTSRENAAPLIPLSPAEALAQLGARLDEHKRIVGIGSPRASLESNYALRTLVGSAHFFSGMSETEHHHASLILRVLKDGPAPSWSVQEVEQADAALILGEDLVHTAPRLALALRQSVRNQPMEQLEGLKIPRWQDAAVRTALHDQRGPLYIGAVAGTSLDDVATRTFRGTPHDLARLGCAVAHEICPDSPNPSELSLSEADLIREIAEALASAKRPVVVAGTGTGDAWVIKAAANVAWALRRRGVAAGIAFALQDCNSLGIALLDGKSLGETAATGADQSRDALIILENDLRRRLETATLDRWLERFDPVIVIDHVDEAVPDQADFVLPASSIACSDGTLVNNEGCAQRFFSAMPKEPEVEDSWRWVCDIARRASRNSFERMSNWNHLEDIHTAIAGEFPLLRRIGETAPPAPFRISDQKIPRAPHRFSGRTALPMLETIHEPQPPDDPESPLAFSMEGTPEHPPSPLIPFFWSSRWNSSEAVNKFQDEVGGPLRNENTGIRLFEAQSHAEIPFFENAPAPSNSRNNQLLLVPLPRLFGTEELSARGSAIRERTPQAAVVLNPRDADRLGVRKGHAVDMTAPGLARRLPVETDETMAGGIAGLLLVGDGAYVTLPAWVTLRKAPST
ncbi:MAG: NADH:ubiquinone oxidoreductase, chain G [Candidatus Nitrospira kreftii]|uniref:NADH-quinone oxidoreductase subunit G n=1 Tax=Candidatus Nitrospira kreftii TaxID=2652173 RepID=A0A7S8FES5_9BACT|nr:MAG: NADH:ubiquinone oxidoreductase, chain G [Candidatus Nitrospira kreftii]